MIRKGNFTFLSADGKTTISGRTWAPEDGSAKGVVQLVHGMVEHILRYDVFAQFLADNGFLVVGHDHLGHGGSVQKEQDYGFFGKDPCALLVKDIHKVRTHFQKEGQPYFILGHSMGSFLLRVYLAQYGEGLSGAIIMGTGYMPANTIRLAMLAANAEGLIRGERHRSTLLQQLSYGAPYKRYDVTGKDHKNSWLTKDEGIVQKYFSDKKCGFVFTVNGYKGLFESVRDSCSPESIAKIPKALPILLNAGSEDPVGDLGKGVRTVERLFREAGIRDVTCTIYEGDRHEILNENDREQVYRDILEWLAARMGAPAEETSDTRTE